MRRKPTTLYFYEHKELKKHKIAFNCMLEVVRVDPPNLLERQEGIVEMVRYRCRGPNGDRDSQHDHYGYGSRLEAKLVEIKEARIRIHDEEQWLKQLQPEPTLKHSPDCELGDNYKDCPACQANAKM